MNHRIKKIWPTLVDKVKPTTEYPVGIGGDGQGVVMDELSFVNPMDGNTYTGTVSAYVDDNFYNTLLEQMLPSLSTGASSASYNIYPSPSYRLTFSDLMTYLKDLLGNDDWHNRATVFYDPDHLSSTHNQYVYEQLSQWFNLVQSPIKTGASVNKYVGFPDVSNPTGVCLTQKTVSSSNIWTGLANFISDVTYYGPATDRYNTITPFYQCIVCNGQRIDFYFPIFPSAAINRNGTLNISAIPTYTYNGTDYIFIPSIHMSSYTGSNNFLKADYGRITAAELTQKFQTNQVYSYLTETPHQNTVYGEDVWLEPEYVGVLTDTLSCNIEQEKNGVFDLTLTYPAGGKYANEIYNGRYILADYMYGNDVSRKWEYKKDTGYQIFKIYKVDKSIDTLTVYAHHYSYAMDGIIVEPFSLAGTPEEILAALQEHAINNRDYIVLKEWVPDGGEADDTSKTYTVKAFKTLRECLYGSEGSFLQLFGGRFAYEDNHVYWADGSNGYLQGNETGYKVEYGVNMTEFDYSVDTDDVYYGVIGVATDPQTEHVFSGYYITTTDISDAKRILVVDMTDKFGEQFPTYVEGQTWYDEVNTLCEKYYEDNNKDTPDVSLQTGYVVSLQRLEGIDKSITEQVALGDVVQVVFKKWDIAVKLEVVRIEYDAIQGRNTSITLNQPKQTLAATIASLIV